jgi:microcystin-dependent protein
MRYFTVVLALLGAAWQSALSFEGAPSTIQYQGQVLDAQGAPLAPTSPANYTIEFRLFSALTGGTLIWSEQQLVTVSNGRFSVRLGEGQSIGAEPNNLTNAFIGKDRFIGITVKPSTTEIVPRLAFLSAPYAFAANTVTRVSQQAGTVSNMRLTSIGYDTRKEESGAVLVALTTDKRTNLVAAGPRGTVAQLPVAGGMQEILVAKTDSSTQVVAVAPPVGGKINGSTNMLRLKALGESVTLQNIGGNDWWIVKDTRDNTPVGTIISYAAATPPAGYLPCAGQSLLRDDHPDLFTAIGTAWGASSEADSAIEDGTRFNLPDLSGRFLRGVDPTSNGEDDDAGFRTRLMAGGNDGRNVGTYQLEQLFAHKHSVTDPGHSHVGSASAAQDWTIVSNTKAANADGEADVDFQALHTGEWATSGQFYTPSVSGSGITLSRSFTGITATEETSPSGTVAMGNETRPVNAAVRYCIKY